MWENDLLLHWNRSHWQRISWDDWSAFRGLSQPSVGLPGIAGGVHHFVVVVRDEGVPVNIIPHKYLIEPDGRMGRDNFGGLTREERQDLDRLMLVRRFEPGDEERLNEIREKMGAALDLPAPAHRALADVLQTPRKGSAAERFLASVAGAG